MASQLMTSQRMTSEPMTSEVMTLKQVRALSEEELTSVLLWVDAMPLSREKRNLTRDFSDGGLLVQP